MYGQLIFHVFEGLPKTWEWKTWTMITKGALPSLTTITSYNKLKLKLTAEEVELRRDRDIEPGHGLFSKSTKGGRSQKSSNYYRKGVPPCNGGTL